MTTVPAAHFPAAMFGITNPAIKFISAFGQFAKELVRRAESGEDLANGVHARQRANGTVIVVKIDGFDPDVISNFLTEVDPDD